MDQDIYAYEFNWWASFIGHIALLIISFAMIYLWFYLYQIVSDHNTWRLNVLLLLSFIIIVFPLPNLIYLCHVPKIIRFRENNMVIFNPLSHMMVYRYDEISRILINELPGWKWNALFKWFMISSFRVRFYFADNSIKIMINPDEFPEFSALLEMIQRKGLVHVIERK